eukprot:6898519-Pyramimonas_sp.AAC.1
MSFTLHDAKSTRSSAGGTEVTSIQRLQNSAVASFSISSNRSGSYTWPGQSQRFSGSGQKRARRGAGRPETRGRFDDGAGV